MPASPRLAPEASTAAAPATRLPSARITEFDALRGAAIILVMYLHASFSAWPGTPHWELVTLRVIDLFAHAAVPVFLFMSGFLLSRDRATDFTTFAQHRLKRLVLPLTVWVVAALVFEMWRQGGLTLEMVQSFALLNTEGQFYYLLVLVVLTFAGYPLRHCSAAWLRRVVVVAFVLNFLTVAYYSTQSVEGFYATLAYRNPLMWGFAFTYGYSLGRTRGNVDFGRRVTLAVTAGMAIVAAVYLVQGETSGHYPDSYFGVTVFLFAALGLVGFPAWMRALEASRRGRMLLAPAVALAPYAFAIYLVHKPYFVGYLSDRLLSHGPLGHDYLTLILANVVVGGALTVALAIAIERMAPRFAAFFLGIEHARPKPATTEAQRAA